MTQIIVNGEPKEVDLPKELQDSVFKKINNQWFVSYGVIDYINKLKYENELYKSIINEVRERVLNEGKPLPSQRELLEILDKGV